jgi:cell division protease FtsH
MALGLTQSLPEEEKYMYSTEYCEIVLAHMMGGRAAEILSFREATSGAGNDIERATELARKMVCDWGMSEKLGPISFGKKEEAIFLGREIAQHRDYSEETAEAIDLEVRRLVEDAYQRAFAVLKKHRKMLEAIAQELLERETLTGDEIDQLMAGKTLPPWKKPAEGEPTPPPAPATEPKKAGRRRKIAGPEPALGT